MNISKMKKNMAIMIQLVKDTTMDDIGESEVVDHEKNSFEQHSNGYYKKGHHRTGFTNTIKTSQEII